MGIETKIEGGLCLCRSFEEETLSAPTCFKFRNSGLFITIHCYQAIFFLKNNRSAFCNSSFVKSAFLQLFDQGLIKEEPSPPHFVPNLFTVAEGKKLRLRSSG